MKKTLLFMMAILLIVLMVSCNSDVGTSGSDNLVEVKIAGEGNSKSLSTQFSSNVPEVSELVWFYTAVKNDTGLYATGQQEDWKEVKEKVNDAYVTGLADSSLGQFSAGAWIFSFKGVTASTAGTNSEVIVYECASLLQTVDSTTATWRTEEDNDTVYLTIPLTLGSGVNKAKVVFTDLSFTLPSVDLNPNYSGEFSLIISENGSETSIESVSASVNNGVVTFTLPETNYYEYYSAGSHTYTFTVKLGDSDVASLPSYNANVSLGTTASVSGSIEEYANTKYYVVAKTITGEKVTVSNSSEKVSGSNTETMTFTVANTPDSVATGNASSTRIEFTNGYSEASTSDSYYIAQETYGAEAAGNFIVTAGENSTNAVAGIDLDLYKVVDQGEDEKQTVTNQTVQVTTTIATGLTDVAVNGATLSTSANGVTLESYNPETGVLVFTTTHFSQFLVTSSDEAINVTQNKAYAKFSDFIGDTSVNNDTIMLLKDVEMTGTDSCIIMNTEGFTLEGNNRSISYEVAALKSAFLDITNSNNTQMNVRMSNLTINTTNVKFGLIIDDYCTAVMNNVKMNSDNCCVTSTGLTSNLTINGGTYTFTKTSGSTRSDYSPMSDSPIAVQYGGTITINDATINSTDGGVLVWPSGGSLIANNCSISSTSYIAFAWICNGTNNTRADSVIRLNNCILPDSVTGLTSINASNAGEGYYAVVNSSNCNCGHKAEVYVNDDLVKTVTPHSGN